MEQREGLVGFSLSLPDPDIAGACGFAGNVQHLARLLADNVDAVLPNGVRLQFPELVCSPRSPVLDDEGAVLGRSAVDIQDKVGVDVDEVEPLAIDILLHKPLVVAQVDGVLDQRGKRVRGHAVDVQS